MRHATHHRIEIDGLRSLAILPVLFYHAGVPGFSGGYIGVDVFFVISGFLITSLILKELSQGSFSILTFYERRARRILPALFFVMLVTLVAALPWMLPNDLQDLFLSYLGVSTFSSNVLFWLQSGYFDAGVELKPMLHTWSLAVEEQFYVLFPLLLILIWRFGMGVLGAVLIAIAIISFSLTLTINTIDAAANFYLLPTRAWELLLGSLTSLLFARYNLEQSPHQLVRLGASVSGAAGMIMIVSASLIFDNTTAFPGVAALLPTIGTCLILFFATRNTLIARLLSLQPLVLIGLVSYSAYLWHQPILAFARLNQMEGALLWLAIPISLALAYLSWRFIEKPFRNRQFLTQKTVLLLASAASLTIAVIGYIGYKSDGLQFRLSTEAQAIARFSAYPSEKLYRQDACFLQPNVDHLNFDTACYEFAETGVKQLLWGDSHAAALSMGFEHWAGTVAQLTSSACPPLLHIDVPHQSHCRGINQHILNFVTQSQPDVIWLHANWIDYEQELATLSRTLDAIHASAPNASVFVLGGVPQWKPTLPHVLLKQQTELDAINTIDTPLVEFLEPVDETLQKSTESSEAKFVSILNLTCNGQSCKATASVATDSPKTSSHQTLLEPMAWDNAHLTLAGSIYIGQYLQLLLQSD